MTLKKYLCTLACGLSLVAFSNSAMAETLTGAVTKALQENPDVQVQVKAKMIAETQVREAQGGYYPDLDLSSDFGYQYTDNEYTRTRTFTSDDDESQTRARGTLSLRQMIFDGFETPNLVDEAMANSDAQAYRLVAQAEQTGLDTIQAFVEVMRRSRIVQLARANVATHRKYLGMVEERQKTGIGSRADVSQGEARLTTAEATLLEALNGLRDAVASYERIVGESPHKLERPNMPLAALPDSLDTALEMAMVSHPAILAAEKDVNAAYFQAEATKALFLPRFDIELEGTEANDINGVDGRDTDLQALLVMRYNLYNGGSDSARQRSAVFERSRVQSVLDQVRRLVAEEMKFSWNDMVTSRKRVDTLESVLASNIQVRDAYLEQFELGQRSLLDLLDSENELFIARNNLVNERYVALFNSYRVLTSMGKLLPSINVTIPEHYTKVATARTSGVKFWE